MFLFNGKLHNICGSVISEFTKNETISMRTFFFYFILFLGSAFSSRGQQVTIQPSILEFHAAPGMTESQAIRITNVSASKVIFEAYLADWLRDTTGAHQYFRPDTLSRSCASWVHLSKQFIEIEPGKTEELLVQLKTPEDGKAGSEMKWAMLFLQSAKEQDSASRMKKELSTRIKELVRIGVHIYQTPPQLTKMSGRLVALKPVTDEKNAFELYMENTGELMLQSKARLELTEISSGKEYKLNWIEFPVFPEAKRKIKLIIPSSIPPGQYSVLAVMDIGEGAPLEALEKVIEVK